MPLKNITNNILTKISELQVDLDTAEALIVSNENDIETKMALKENSKAFSLPSFTGLDLPIQLDVGGIVTQVFSYSFYKKSEGEMSPSDLSNLRVKSLNTSPTNTVIEITGTVALTTVPVILIVHYGLELTDTSI